MSILEDVKRRIKKDDWTNFASIEPNEVIVLIFDYFKFFKIAQTDIPDSTWKALLGWATAFANLKLPQDYIDRVILSLNCLKAAASAD